MDLQVPLRPLLHGGAGHTNRLLGRSGVPIEDYLRQWEASCAELRASPLLPTRLREILGAWRLIRPPSTISQVPVWFFCVGFGL